MAEQIEEVSNLEQPQAVAEKMIPQSQVNKIVGARLMEAREKADRELQMENERLKSQLEASKNQASSMGGMQQMSPEQIRQMIAEQTQRQLQEQRDAQLEQLRLEHSQRVASEFVNKMESGKHKYDDFDKVVGEVDFRQVPEIVALTHNLDNAPDVVYELMKHPQKVAQVLTLANKSEVLAQRAIKEIADSIKINDAAKNAKSVNEPVGQINPSAIGTDDGSMTTSDFRNQPWLMG